MANKYEERLGTERMLPLIFKMALPAVAAQFVNGNVLMSIRLPHCKNCNGGIGVLKRYPNVYLI